MHALRGRSRECIELSTLKSGVHYKLYICGTKSINYSIVDMYISHDGWRSEMYDFENEWALSALYPSNERMQMTVGYSTEENKIILEYYYREGSS